MRISEISKQLAEREQFIAQLAEQQEQRAAVIANWPDPDGKERLLFQWNTMQASLDALIATHSVDINRLRALILSERTLGRTFQTLIHDREFKMMMGPL